MHFLKLSAFSLGTLFWVAVPIVSAQPRDWGGYPMGWHYMWGSMGVGMFIFMIIFWILIVAGAVALFRWLWSGGSTPRPFGARESEAEEILKARFANGEIDEEEFNSKLQILRKS